MFTIGIIIISVLLIIDHSIRTQNTTINNVNISGKQIYLMERIEKQVYDLANNKEALSDINELNKLKELSNQFEGSHDYLYSKNKKEGNNIVLDSLFEDVNYHYDRVFNSINNVLNNSNKNTGAIDKSLQTIWESEMLFCDTMNLIVNNYQEEASEKLRKLKNTIYSLIIIAALILIGEFIFVIVPAFNQLFKKNNELKETNNELVFSESKIKENILELEQLKTDLEIKDKYNKIFIEQAPTAIAMLDNNMKYMAVSQRWIKDYKMEGQEIIGRSHYDIFPEIGEDWKANHQKGLKGAIDVCDGAPFVRGDGTVQWVYWDVRPWYISEGNIGGLIMHTGDISDQKEKEEEKRRVDKILESTNKVARIGTWELDIATDKYTLSKITCEILEVPEDFEAYGKESLHFYKEGSSRDKIVKSIKELIKFGTPFDVELEMITAEGNIVWIRKIAQAEYNEGKCESIFGIFQDITSSKEKEEERIQIEKILDKTNEVARIGAWEINLEKDRIFWSKMVREIHEVPENYEPDLETAINFFKEGESRDILEKVVGEAMEHGTPYDIEIELVTLKGNILWTRAMGQAEIVDGTCIRLFGVFQDINDKKLSQLALSKAHTELKAIFNSEAVAIVATEKDGVISQFNRGAEILTGYSASEMIGLQRPTLFHLQEELDKFRIDIAKQYDKNPVGFSAQEELAKHSAFDTREWHYFRKDGSTIPVQLTLTSIKDEKNKLIGFLGISTDISEKVIVQDELLRKNQLLNFAEEITLMGNWQWDTVADRMEWSNNLYNILELDKETGDLNFDTYFNLVHPDDKDIVTKYFEKTVEEKRLDRFTHRIIAGEGKFKIIEILGEVITNDKDEVIEMIGTCQDVTAIKTAEKELYEAHTQLKAILNSGPIAIVSTNNKGVIEHFNHGSELLLGYSASEMIGLKNPEIYHLEEELLNFKEDIAKRFDKDPSNFNPYEELAKNDAFDTREWTYRRKDGSTFPVQLTLTGIKDEQGIKKGFLGAAIDISDRKLVQNELLRKNQLLNFAEEITLMGNWQWDTVADKVEWSDNLYNIFKLDKEIDNLNFDTYFNFVHPEDKDIVTDYFNKVVDKSLKRFTHRIIAGDGDLKFVQLIGEVITNSNGEVIEMIGTCQDITAIKAAERELYEAHIQLQAIFNSGPIAIVTTDIDGVINHFNNGAEILTGFSASEMIGLQTPFVYHVEEELENFKNDIAKKYGKNPVGFHPQLELSKQNAYDTREWTYVKKDGTTLPVQLTLTGIKDEQGKNIGFLGVSTDVSERRKAENELVRKNQLLSFAEKITMMGNWQLDLVSNNMKWSTNLYHIFGLEENTKITYDTFLSFVHPEDVEIIARHQQIAYKDKKFDSLIHRIKLKDGTVKTLQLLAEIITDTSGRIVEMLGTCQDVTQQKMAEKKFRGLLESAPDAIVIVNEKGKIQLINKQAEKLFGYVAADLFEKPVEILIPERFTGSHEGHRDGFFSSPKTRRMGLGKELYGVNKNGLEIPIQISLSPLQTEEGLLVSAAIRDITEQKLSESKIIKAKENLEVLASKLTAQNTQLADFAHITSHNLRAPVSNLNSLLDFYNTSETDEEKVSLFEKFEKVISHLTLTLDTLVNAIKIKNKGSESLEGLEDIVFDDVLNKTKEILAGEILKTDAIIISDFSKINKISYNEVYLESIFLNLVGNAIKYRDKNRVLELFIESEIEDGKIKLKFKDNGMGINLERHGHKLFGLNKVFHRHPDAKGVGLYMTKTQVEAMGGTISAKSKVNEGSTFYINF
tara:strand:+ start:143610 stop:148919 length:5310 start_codon:yes stop_codon:yes gene_type:complete